MDFWSLSPLVHWWLSLEEMIVTETWWLAYRIEFLHKHFEEKFDVT